MAKTKIEWCDYTVNPVKGLCPTDCKDTQGKSYCYARRMYKRFKWNPEIRMEPDWMEDLPKKPARVFIGSTMELFGDWVEEWMWDSIWQYVNDYPQHTFLFLTKQPQNLSKWSPFPENVWVGVSATNAAMFIEAGYSLEKVKATVKFISAEPLLDWQHGNPGFIATMLKRWGIGWIIIGQQTPVKASTTPKLEWISEIVKAADQAGIPVFLNNNLLELVNYESPETAFAFNKEGFYRQEIPGKGFEGK